MHRKGVEGKGARTKQYLPRHRVPGLSRGLGFLQEAGEGANYQSESGRMNCFADDKLKSLNEPRSEGLAWLFEGFAGLTERPYPAGITGLFGE